LNSASGGTGSVALSWSAPASNGGSAITGYRIYRSTASGLETLFTTVGNVTSWSDFNVVNGTTYYYKVSALNSVGEGSQSNERFATPAAAATAPGAPTLNSASGGTGSVALSWSAPASNGGSAITGYRVYRSTASGAETLLTTLGNVTSWTDSNVVNGTTYYYKVSALNSVGEGTQSGELSGQPKAIAPPAPAPAAFSKLLPGNSKSGVKRPPHLTWESSTGATSYQVCASLTSGACSSWTTVTGTSYDVPSTQPNKTYYWQVRAVNANGVTDANGGTWWSFRSK